MAVDLSLSTIGSGFNRTPINNNFTAIQAALDDALSRSGNTPNEMEADLDLNSNSLLNVADLTAVRLFVGGTEITSSALAKGNAGWSPAFSIVSDSARRVLQLSSWVNGEGTIPTAYVGQYVGASGFTTILANAIDIRGTQGATGPGSGDVVAAQNLNDLASKPTAFDNIKQAATTTSPGVLEIATSSEAIAQTDSTRAITPLLMSNFVPVGVIFDYAGVTAPSGWLFPYGQAVSRTTYSALFSVLGTTYGVGDSTTTFNLPDFRGRVAAGQDDMGGTSANRLTGLSGGLNGDTLGATGGLETHTLVELEIPAHTHTAGPQTARYGANGQSYSSWMPAAGDSDRNSVTLTTNATGGGGAHNNVQPTIIVNKIIFVGV